MKVLFYYDPISHRGDAMWRSAHTKADAQVYRGLTARTEGKEIECRVLINERYVSALNHDWIPDHEIITVKESDFLEFFSDYHADINRLWHSGQYTQEQMNGVAGIISACLESFEPEIIITWTPAPFLKKLFPDALILHKESGLFQRAPFPSTFFLDPLGGYKRSIIPHVVENLKTRKLPPIYLETLERLRTHFCGWTLETSPFKDIIDPYRAQFKYLLLLPLQYNGYFTFDGVSKFRTQLELAEYVLESVSENVGVIITRHTYSSFSELEEEYVINKFKNAIFIAESNHYKNPSDLMIPYVDGVATVTSTTGLKALFWKKKLISLCDPYLGWVDDATDLSNSDALFSTPYDAEKDKFLAWFILCYSLPQHYNGSKNWTYQLFERILEKYREVGPEKLFDKPFCDINRLGDELIRVSKKLTIPEVNEDAVLEDYVRSLPASTKQKAATVLMNKEYTVLPPKTRGEYEFSDQAQGMGGTNIVFLYSSGRWNASGLYLQDLMRNLVGLGDQCLILAEGDIPQGGEEDGVQWRNFAFDGYLMSKPLKDEVLAFKPDVVYVINVRLKPMRVALELHVACGAKIAVQSEDDDLLIYEKFHKYADRELLQVLDKPDINHADIEIFLSKINWDYTLEILSGKRVYRDVEPILRVLCYKLSILNTAIWHPLQNKLATSFGKPGLILPPIVEIANFDPEPFSSDKRAQVLRKYKIDPQALVIFLGGTIYDFSPEFEVFLECLNIAKESALLCLVVSGRSRVDVKGLVNNKLSSKVGFVSMGVPPDEEYFDMMKAADVIAAPGYPDIFNELRLSSRLVKAMAFAKPIFTYRCGFGESLDDGVNAILTEGESACEWAEKLLVLTDEKKRIAIGQQSRIFAERYFDAPVVASQLSKCLRPMKGLFPVPPKKDKPQRKKSNIEKNPPPQKSKFVRKWNKLRTNPKLFFIDAWYGLTFKRSAK